MRALALLVLVVAGCGVVIPRPDAALAARAAAAGQVAEMPVLERGYTRFVAQCGGCHALPEPASCSRAQWPAEVRRMAKRAKLDASGEADVLAYLLAAGSP